MASSPTPGIYLCVDFNWPEPFQKKDAENARNLHDVLQGKTWIKEVVAASGGIGAGPSSTWIFWLENYAALDRLLRDQENTVAQAYRAFFSQMPLVVDKIREEVLFL